MLSAVAHRGAQCGEVGKAAPRARPWPIGSGHVSDTIANFREGRPAGDHVTMIALRVQSS